MGLALRRGGAPKIPELKKEVDELRATSARFETERAAVHAALDAVVRDDRIAAKDTAHDAKIGPSAQGGSYDYSESQRTTDDYLELCR